LNVSNQGSSTGQQIITRLEDVRLFANQTVTFSFWAKADASRTLGDVKIGQNFGSGGSGAVETTVTLNSTSLTTSWARYSGTVTLPSVSGKTIGTSSYLYVFITPPTTTYTLDTWGWQLEAGSVATPFTTATGTLAGELAACQRYYFRFNSNANEVLIPAGFANSTTTASGRIQFPVVMRVAPTSLDSANLRFGNYVGSNFDMSSVAYNQASTIAAQVYGTVTGATAGHVGAILGSASNAYVGLSAEL
jgi:hypothetical protein